MAATTRRGHIRETIVNALSDITGLTVSSKIGIKPRPSAGVFVHSETFSIYEAEGRAIQGAFTGTAKVDILLSIKVGGGADAELELDNWIDSIISAIDAIELLDLDADGYILQLNSISVESVVPSIADASQDAEAWFELSVFFSQFSK